MMHVRAFSFLGLCARNSLTFAALRPGDGLGPRCQYYRSPSQWLCPASLVGIFLCARSFPPRGAPCDHRRRPVHRSMRARPFAGAARPGGAPFPVPPLPPAPKAGQHGPAALFAAAAAPGPSSPPTLAGSVDSQESRDFFGNFPWESGKILRRCSVGGSPSPRTPFDR